MVIDNERMYIDIPKTILGSAALTAVGGLIKGLPYLPAAAVLSPILLMVSQTDAKKRKIPNEFVLLMLVPAAVLLVTEVLLGRNLLSCIMSRIVGALILSVPLLLASMLTRGGVGGGDIKFIGAAGLLLGALKVAYAVFIGMSIATIFIIARLIWYKVSGNTDGDRRIAAGPFFAIGIWLVFLFM